MEKAQHALYAYTHPDEVKGKKVVIIGGGAIGCESGYFFASQWGAQVDILEMRDDVCKDSGMSQRMALIPRMKKAGMGTFCSVQVQGDHRPGREVPGQGRRGSSLTRRIWCSTAAAAAPTATR